MLAIVYRVTISQQSVAYLPSESIPIPLLREWGQKSNQDRNNHVAIATFCAPSFIQVSKVMEHLKKLSDILSSWIDKWDLIKWGRKFRFFLIVGIVDFLFIIFKSSILGGVFFLKIKSAMIEVSKNLNDSMKTPFLPKYRRNYF